MYQCTTMYNMFEKRKQTQILKYPPSLCRAVATTLAPQGHAYPTYQESLPNGGNLPHPCKPNYRWPGVGHLSPLGGGALNPFGEDFKVNLTETNVIYLLETLRYYLLAHLGSEPCIHFLLRCSNRADIVICFGILFGKKVLDKPS